jgi:hypothetical protein
MLITAVVASAAHVTYGQQSLRDCPLRGMRRPSVFLAGASPQTRVRFASA